MLRYGHALEPFSSSSRVLHLHAAATFLLGFDIFKHTLQQASDPVVLGMRLANPKFTKPAQHSCGCRPLSAASSLSRSSLAMAAGEFKGSASRDDPKTLTVRLSDLGGLGFWVVRRFAMGGDLVFAAGELSIRGFGAF